MDPWRFVVLQNKEVLARISEGLPHGKFLAKAGVGIVVCGDVSAAHDKQLAYLMTDVAAAIENILIAAHSLGLGACWLGVHPRVERAKHIKTVLGMPEDDNMLPIAVVSIGYPDEKKEARTRYKEEFVHWDKW